MENSDKIYWRQTNKSQLNNFYLFKIWVLERCLGTTYSKMKDFANQHGEKVEEVIDRNYEYQADNNPDCAELIRNVKEVVEWTMSR